MAALKISAVSKTLGGSLVLDTVDLTVETGTRAAIVGESGSGKSTLLRLIAGFDKPDAGSISIGEAMVSDETRFMAAHRRGVGFVAQDGALFPHLTALQNIQFGVRRSPTRTARAREVAGLVALDTALLGRYPHELSGGQQQRVALARALAPRPSVVLLDEPFSALDTGLRNSTRRSVIQALQASAVTTILVTHDQQEALSFGQQIAVISGGRIVQTGSPAEVFANPVDRETAQFLGDAIFLPVQLAAGRAHSPLGEVRVARQPPGAMIDKTAVALARPGQIVAQHGRENPNAEVISAQTVGAVVEFTVRLLSWPEPVDIALSLPLATCEIEAGDLLTLEIIGSVVLY